MAHAMQENDDGSEPVLLGEAAVNWYASIVADGTATPADARTLLAEFVRQVDASRVSPCMIEHMRACVAAFLVGRKELLPAPREGRHSVVGVPTATLDKAFGLVRVAPGNPRTDDDTYAEAAMEVLQKRMGGASLESATAAVAEDRKARGVRVSAESQVRKAWSEYKQDALINLRIARLGESAGWTTSERDRLTQLFHGEPWFTPPGVDAKARLDAILAEVDRPGADSSDLKQRVQAAIAKFDGPSPPKIRRNTSA